MNLVAIKQNYDEQFSRVYPQVPMESKWRGSKDNGMQLTVIMRGERTQPMTIDEVIAATATFQQKGRPMNKHNCYIG